MPCHTDAMAIKKEDLWVKDTKAVYKRVHLKVDASFATTPGGTVSKETGKAIGGSGCT